MSYQPSDGRREREEKYIKPISRFNRGKPWLNADGSPVDDDVLREISKEWKPHDWENYLRSLEVEQEHVILDDPFDLETLSNRECSRLFFTKPSGDEHPRLQRAINSAMRLL